MNKSLAMFGLLTAALIGTSGLVQAVEPRPLMASATVDVASLADGAGATNTAIPVPGAALGDFCRVSFGVDLAGITATCYVSAANAAVVRVQNESGGTVDLASTTVRVQIVKSVQF